MNTEAKENRYFYKPGEQWVISKEVNGKTEYSHETLEEVRTRKNDSSIIIIGEAALDDSLEKLVKETYIDEKAKYIDEERYDYLLNCLPPCKWHSYLSVSYFHMSERLTHDVVTWVAKSGDTYVEFNHFSTASDNELNQKFKELVAN